MLLDGVHLRQCLARGHPRSQAPNTEDDMDGPVIQQQRTFATKRRIDVGLSHVPAEALRKHANQRVIHPAERDRGPNRRLVSAKPVLPQTMAYDDRRRPAIAVLLWRETASECLLHSQRAEEAGGDLHALQVFRRAEIGQIERMRCECGDLLKGTSAALPIDEIGIRKIHRVLERPVIDGHHDQPIRLAVRKRRE